jgi:hypothetical protein
MKSWNYKDFDIFNDLENRKNSTHNKVGGDKSGKVEYKFNELGFRGDSLETYHKSKKKFVVFGCSHTAGI